MTPLLFVLRHNIHVAARFLFNFVFQSDPDAKGLLSDHQAGCLLAIGWAIRGCGDVAFSTVSLISCTYTSLN